MNWGTDWGRDSVIRNQRNALDDMGKDLAGARDDAQRARINAINADQDTANAQTAGLAVAVMLAKVRNENSQLQEQINDLKLQLISANAEVAGRDAQLDAMKAQNPNCDLMKDSGQRFKKSGNVKTKLRIIFEQVFDKALAQAGITNPTAYRLD